MKRREFITLLGGAAAWPIAARAAAGDAGDWIPKRHIAARIWPLLVGISPRAERNRLHRGPQRRDRIPMGRGPTSTPANVAAMKATKTIPIAVTTSSDPVALGPVASLNKPGGNVTGAVTLN